MPGPLLFLGPIFSSSLAGCYSMIPEVADPTESHSKATEQVPALGKPFSRAGAGGLARAGRYICSVSAFPPACILRALRNILPPPQGCFMCSSGVAEERW